MRIEIKFSVELDDTDTALVTDMMHQDDIELNDFAKNEVTSKLGRLLITRKREVGAILAQTGVINEALRIGSAEMAEAHKSPW